MALDWTPQTIRMIVDMSGSRYDGRDWREFPAGSLLTCPAWEAADHLRGKRAVAVNPEDLPAPQPPKVQSGGRVMSPAAARDPHERLEAAADGHEDPGPAPAAGGDVIVPAPAEPKRVWVDHAVSQGADPDTAKAMTKEQLMSAYGGRL